MILVVLHITNALLFYSFLRKKKSTRNCWIISPPFMWHLSTKHQLSLSILFQINLCSGYCSSKNLHDWRKDYNTVADSFYLWMNCTYFSNPGLLVLGMWPFSLQTAEPCSKALFFGTSEEASLFCLWFFYYINFSLIFFPF